MEAVPDTDERSEAQALAEEEAREKARHEQEQAAAKQLSLPVGGIKPTKARLQVTGGAVDIQPHLLPDKDEELEVRCTGWVKTVKLTTEGKGGIAVREAIFVIDDVIVPE